MVIAHPFQKDYMTIPYETDDLRTNGETTVLCALNAATQESLADGATAPKTLRVEKSPNHALVDLLRIHLCIVHFLYFSLLCEHNSWSEHRGNYLVRNRAVLHTKSFMLR
jgi:hypothetical protein